MTYYRDFIRPDRQNVPDSVLERSISFAAKRSMLGHNVIRVKVKSGYRVYWSAKILQAGRARES